MQMAPEAYQVRKAPSFLAFPVWHDARCRYLRHDGVKWPVFAERQEMNTRQTIEVLKRRIKSMALLLGASLTVRTRAFGDGPDRAAVRALSTTFAHISGNARLMS